MSKLPAPVASFNSAPVPRPVPHAFGAQDAKRIPAGSVAKALDGEPRRAFGQRALRQPPELEFERPSRDSYRFAGADRARDARPRPDGPSAAFFAQLIGQSVQGLGVAVGPSGSSETDLAHSAYRQAGGAASPHGEVGSRLNFAV